MKGSTFFYDFELDNIDPVTDHKLFKQMTTMLSNFDFNEVNKKSNSKS
jgi:hypothetical protein